jgi:hypothetical protein
MSEGLLVAASSLGAAIITALFNHFGNRRRQRITEQRVEANLEATLRSELVARLEDYQKEHAALRAAATEIHAQMLTMQRENARLTLRVLHLEHLVRHLGGNPDELPQASSHTATS